jgi:hypothetical protein
VKVISVLLNCYPHLLVLVLSSMPSSSFHSATEIHEIGNEDEPCSIAAGNWKHLCWLVRLFGLLFDNIYIYTLSVPFAPHLRNFLVLWKMPEFSTALLCRLIACSLKFPAIRCDARLTVSGMYSVYVRVIDDYVLTLL